MKPFHVVAPFVLTAAFVPFYVHFARAHARQEAEIRAAAEQQRIDNERLREQRERESIERIRQSQLEQQLAVEEQERKRRAAWEAGEAVLRDQLDTATAALQTQKAANKLLRARLDTTRANRRSIEHAAFVANHELELRQIERRNIDLEIQREVQLTVARLEPASDGDTAIFPTPRFEGASSAHPTARDNPANP
jgi:hypothetical protein